MKETIITSEDRIIINKICKEICEFLNSKSYSKNYCMTALIGVTLASIDENCDQEEAAMIAVSFTAKISELKNI
jgi:hypothetical protein